MSNALTVVSAIPFRPYRFSSSNETGVHLKFIKNKLQGILLKVSVNPNHVFKQKNRAWLRERFAWLRAARRTFKRSKYLMPTLEKNGGVGSPPKFTLT
jgi:hypothetical protein